MTTLPPDVATGFAAQPVLTGDQVVLRPFTAEDAPVMAAIIDDPEVREFTGPPRSPLTPDRLLAWYGSRAQRTDRLDLAVTDRATGELVGESVLFDWDEANRSCFYRILLGQHGRDRGLGTETIRLTLAHGFGTVRLNRVALGVYTFNHRARRAYEKAGFVTEGVERKALLRDGRAFDQVLMSVLAAEWAVHHGHPEDGTASCAR